MAGKPKITKEVKQQVIELATQGYTVPQIREMFPDYDGHSVAGTVQAHRSQAFKNQRSGGFPTTTQAVPPPQPQQPKLVVQSPPIAAPNPTPGLPPSAPMPMIPHTGFQIQRDHAMIEKLDEPNKGFWPKKEDYNIGAYELTTRYPAGTYKFHYYKNGILVGYSSDITVSQAAKGFVATDQQQPNQFGGLKITNSNDASDTIFRAMDAVNRIQIEGERKRSEDKDRQEIIGSKKIEAEAQIASTAIATLEKIANKDNKSDMLFDKMMLMIQEDRKSVDQRHEQQMERMKIEQVNDREKLKMELASKEKAIVLEKERDREYLTKQNELQTEQQKFMLDIYERNLQDTQSSVDAAKEDIAKERQRDLELLRVERKHNNEIFEINKTMDQSARDATLMNTLVQTVGGFQSKVEGKVAQNLTGIDSNQPIPLPTNARSNISQSLNNDPASTRSQQLNQPIDVPLPQTQPANIPLQQPKMDYENTLKSTQESKNMMNQDKIREAIANGWFGQAQEQVFRAISKKQLGSWLGQDTIQLMYEDPRIRTLISIIARYDWDEVLEMCKDQIKPEYATVLKSPEAQKWYDEYLNFIIPEYNKLLTQAQGQG